METVYTFLGYAEPEPPPIASLLDLLYNPADALKLLTDTRQLLLPGGIPHPHIPQALAQIPADALDIIRQFLPVGIPHPHIPQALAQIPLAVPIAIALTLLTFVPILYATPQLLRWIFWLSISGVFTFGTLIYATYTIVIIGFDLVLLALLKTLQTVFTQALNATRFLPRFLRHEHSDVRKNWKKKLQQCNSLAEFNETLAKHQKNTQSTQTKTIKKSPTMKKSWSLSDLSNLPKSNPNQPLVLDQTSQTYNLSPHLSTLLQSTTDQILSNVSSSDSATLRHLLSSIIKRNHLGLDDISFQTTRSLSETGRTGLHPSATSQIQKFQDTVIKGIQFLAEEDESLETLQKSQRNIGNTALMLSGGGSITMYHIGVLRTLIQSNLYSSIPVISGTSGGSIAAAFCATNTEQELLSYVCVSNISTNYRERDDMKKLKIRWFPPMLEQAKNFISTGKLVEDDAFMRTTRYYWGDTTFQEAYDKTKKHVCMTVTASRAASGGGGLQRLLLNHITTPHVTIASAVAASCALPGIMASVKLQMKLPDGTIGNMEVDGVEWIDGSIQADVPFQRVSQLFNVSNFIVSQVNFHVLPFLQKSHHPDSNSSYWRLFQLLGMDVRSRVMSLSNLGLFPSYFGNDISKVIKQKYTGDVTIVPRMRSLDVIGVKAFLNPTVEDMQTYIKEGAEATYPHIKHIKHLTDIEREVNDAVNKLSADSEEEQNPLINGINGVLGLLGLENYDTHKLLRSRITELEAEVRSLKAERDKN